MILEILMCEKNYMEDFPWEVEDLLLHQKYSMECIMFLIPVEERKAS